MSDYVPTSTYVPTTDEVETGFHEFASWLETKYPGEYEQAPEFADWREAMHGFRRWLAEVERAAAAKALDEFENELVTREMPEAGAHINMTPYREGKIDGVNRAAIAAARRAEAYRREETE